MSTANLQQLIENTSHWDKDERYMATNDLCTMLSKDVKIDEHSEQKICAAVLKQLGKIFNPTRFEFPLLFFNFQMINQTMFNRSLLNV